MEEFVQYTRSCNNCNKEHNVSEAKYLEFTPSFCRIICEIQKDGISMFLFMRILKLCYYLIVAGLILLAIALFTPLDKNTIIIIGLIIITLKLDRISDKLSR